ncbi:MAG: tRNA (adenosine(37)-N6)-threonylcarbamoyltransferase complex dimerization subunit type 1 TsaB [Halioglobus sp.]
MANILAIDTSTDACSVALSVEGQLAQRHEVVPRDHSGRLMPMLQELLPNGDLRAAGVDAIAYGVGPGSFTGLRIAASAVQGLAFANNLPAIPVSTLACLAQTAFRQALISSDGCALSTLDARINEIYWAVFSFDEGLAQSVTEPAVCHPNDIHLDSSVGFLNGVGGGLAYFESFPADIRDRLKSTELDVLPNAMDLIPLAEELLSQGQVQSAAEVAPIYVRDEISWKKLADQGKSK